jgi:hypothetical protein
MVKRFALLPFAALLGCTPTGEPASGGALAIVD